MFNKGNENIATPTISNKPRKKKFIPQPKLRRILPKFINFEEYIKENCENKIKILNRETFDEIKRPVIIFFNHFRETCAFHTQWLDRIYKLSLKFDDHIEFIAADIIDIDILYPGRNPLTFCSRLLRPEHQTPKIYARDEKKRIFDYANGKCDEGNLLELCENLLNGSLYPSQPILEQNESNLVKICVFDNFEELVLKSTKNIFLIIDLDGYEENERKANYENLALTVKDYNMEIVYLEAEKNYIPFEYQVTSYPTMVYIPIEDKNNFIYFDGLEQKSIFLKKIYEEPKYFEYLQQHQLSEMQCKTAQVTKKFPLDFKALPEFLRKNYNKNSLEILNREILEKSKSLILIVFMDFQGKCTVHHVEWFNKLNQLAEISTFRFFIADFKDIDVVNSKWKAENLIESAKGKPRIYAFDRLNHSYEFGNFDSILPLYYFTDKIEHGDLYYSQLPPPIMEDDLVKVWTADNFNTLLHSLKKHIFITFYSSEDVNFEELLQFLEILAKEVKDLGVEIVKFDVYLNYVDLEYANDSYPVYYFVAKDNKKDSRHYKEKDLEKDKIMEFIKNNVYEIVD